jgi:hypothetical protein
MKKYLIQFTFGIIQNFIGLIGFIIFGVIGGKYKGKYNEAFVCEVKNRYGSVSLGCFIFVTNYNDERLIKHEYGHTLQSLKLGFLYLLIIGLPSIIWAGFFKKYRQKNNINYYDFYTEKWANKLGGIS